MKISRGGAIPQLEPEGWIGAWQTRLGAARRMFQRSGILSRPITMWGSMTAAWGSFEPVRLLFPNYVVFIAAGFMALALWSVIDLAAILPGEQSFGQEQSQRKERSPLKRDTEAILDRLERLEKRPRADGGTAVVGAECTRCGVAGKPDTHKGDAAIRCPECGDQLYREIDP